MEAEKAVEDYRESFEDKNIQEALDNAVELARIGDRYLSEQEPWNNEDIRKETIHVSLQIIRALAATLYPFTPEASEKIADMLNISIHSTAGVDELMDPLIGGLEPGHELGEREILFEKIDTSEHRDETEEEKDNMENEFNKDTVSFEDFQEMDIRTGKVQKVEEHPNADKLYKIQVDVGEATLQTCAGLKNFYEPKDLDGKDVVVLANLEPTKLRGEKSECMMLAAESENGETVSLLQSDKNVEEGSIIK
jgi:Methionyl-tRNA synthetase